MTTYNSYFDYYADLFDTDTRFRFGVNNMFNQRAPLADREFRVLSLTRTRDYGSLLLRRHQDGPSELSED